MGYAPLLANDHFLLVWFSVFRGDVRFGRVVEEFARQIFFEMQFGDRSVNYSVGWPRPYMNTLETGPLGALWPRHVLSLLVAGRLHRGWNLVTRSSSGLCFPARVPGLTYECRCHNG